MRLAIPQWIRHRAPTRFRDRIRRWKLKGSAVRGAPIRIDTNTLVEILEDLLGEHVLEVSHANVSGYKESNAFVVWAAGYSGRTASLAAKDSDLRPDAYPAVRDFPGGRVGLPEARIYRTASDGLRPNLPLLYRQLHLVKDTHIQYFMQDLNAEHRMSYTARDLLRCTRALLKIEREIAGWVKSDPEVALIDYGGDFPSLLLKYARSALERYVARTADASAAKLLDTWSEVAALYLDLTPDIAEDFVHGDYRVGNIFHLRSDPARIRLVDWEFAGRGWIHNDLASLLKPAGRDTTLKALKIIADSREDWSFAEHWRMYQRCRIERGLLDAGLVANQRLAFSHNPRISASHAPRVLAAVNELRSKAPTHG